MKHALPVLVVTMLGLVAPMSSWAGETHLGDNVDGVAFYLDEDRVTRDGDEVRFFETQKNITNDVKKNFPTAMAMEVQRAIHCDARQAKQLYLRILDSEQKVLGEMAAPAEEVFEPIETGSMLDMEHAYFCTPSP